MKLAVMQPCYLPWRGYFALLAAVDVLVHLDDAALPQGRSYQTRTTVRTPEGRVRLSLPVRRETHQLIRDAVLADDGWRRKHLATLRQHLPRASRIVAPIYARPWSHLADLNIALERAVAEALGIHTPTQRSSPLDVPSRGSERILSLCLKLGATEYVTGHGGAGYLDHERFEAAGVTVRYLSYDNRPYPQPHVPFDPFVTALDLIEHAPDPSRHVGATLVAWRTFLTAVA